MLEIRPVCENCGKSLPNDGDDAMICTFECTFCRECVDDILCNVCPNCGGGFERRPTRPRHLLQKYPPKDDELIQPVNTEKFSELLAKNKDVDPRER